MEKVILSAAERQLKNKTLIRCSQHGFMKERSYLSHLISVNDKVAHLMGEGKAVHAVFLNFSKAFDTVPQYPGEIVQLS